MSHDGTQPSRAPGLPVRKVRVEVVDGPDAGVAPSATARDRLTVGAARGNDLTLRDPTVSQFHLEVRRDRDRIQIHDLGSTNGTLVGPALVRGGGVSVLPGTELGLGETKIRVLDGEVVMVRQGPDRVGDLRGRAPAMRALFQDLAELAHSDAAVLVLGESGTGKELAARALHEIGSRAEGPFVTVDCGALSPQLLASELFGHERGAFTGADRQHIGAFERAHGGTLLLDEIAELDAGSQRALLGVLERRRLRRVGGEREIPIDVRIVAATHADLRACVNAGSFRLDLYYRLAVVLLELPPLRERASDVPLLVEHLLREAGHDGATSEVFDEDTMQRLVAHRWPGNVRELRNVVEATLATGRPPRLHVLGQEADEASGDLVGSVLGMRYRDARARVLAEFEERYLRDLLSRTEGNVRRAAREARMDRSYLNDLLRRHGLR
jgi:DNA-binding NtrC family response regulator